MWSSWLEDAKKKAEDALKATSSIQVAKEKVTASDHRNDVLFLVSENATDVMKEMISRRPEDMTYITNNIIAMGFPGLPKFPNKSIKYNNREIVAAYLAEHHKDHFMIFNLSDELYESILFGDHIISYDLQGMPAPSLGMLMKICIAVETWLQDDSDNVAVLHCLTGKGRTLTMCSCLLAWLGWVENCSEALHLCCDRRGGRVEELTTPSQRRYVQYFGMLLDCLQPRRDPLLLRSLCLQDAPLRGSDPVVLVEVFNCGTLVFTSRTTVPSHAEIDDTVPRTVEVSCGRPIRGNIIVRCRQLQADGVRSSLCRCMVHTGYLSGTTLRLTKDQLDGACGDDRCPDSMCLELRLDVAGEYTPDTRVNRLEMYESLLLDAKSALWREVLFRKERRSEPATEANEKAPVEKAVFDIDSEEEEAPLETKKAVLTTVDPGRDYMLELAMLESSLTTATTADAETEEKKGLTAAEEQSLDTMLQSLDMDSDSDVDSDPDANDFNAEFGLLCVCYKQ